MNVKKSINTQDVKWTLIKKKEPYITNRHGYGTGICLIDQLQT